MNLIFRIKHFIGLSLISILPLFLISCDSSPEERFLWSPDGTHAAMLSDGILHLVSKEGAIIDTFKNKDEEPGTLQVNSFGWLPEKGGLWIHRTRKLDSWKEVLSLLPAEESAKIEHFSKAMPELFSAAAASDDPASDSIPVFEEFILNDRYLFAGYVHAVIHNRESLLEALQSSPKLQEELLMELDSDEEEWELHEVAILSGNASKIKSSTPATLVLRSLFSIDRIKASPTLPIIATTNSDEGLSDVVHLEVHALDGSFHHQVGELESGLEYAWTPDGLSLVIMAPSADTPLHTIHRQLLFHESGRLLSGEELKSEFLATSLTDGRPWLEVLPSGAILFSSLSNTFPALTKDASGKTGLYQIGVDGKTLEIIPIQGDSLPEGNGHFVISPGAKQIAIVETGSSSVSVLELETGELTVVAPARGKWQCRTRPAWRSDTELSFASLDSEGENIQWMLWETTTRTSRNLGDSWPEGTMTGWLHRPETKEEKPVDP